ncbi:unnamed protein product [Leuciscus chuanchicus]
MSNWTLGPLTESTTEKWNQFKTLVSESADSTLGKLKRTHQDWFDESDEIIGNLLEEKRKAYIEWQNDISSTSKGDRVRHLQRQAQTVLRKMLNEWWKRKAEEVQGYADTKNSKMFFSAIKQIPQRTIVQALDLPPTMDELTKAIKQTSPGKASGMDGIPADI